MAAVLTASVMLTGVAAASPASARNSATWTDAQCPRFYDLFHSATQTGVTVCQGHYATNYFYAQNVGTTAWLVRSGQPPLQWSAAATSQSTQTKMLQKASPAPAFSVWFGPGDRFLFTQGFRESSWQARPAETLALFGLNIGAEQVAQSAVKAGITVTASQLIRNRNWRPAFTTCMTALISLLPDKNPSATDEAVATYLKSASTVFSTGGCATQLASAKESTRLTVDMKWAPVAADLARLESKTTWVNRITEGVARLIQALK